MLSSLTGLRRRINTIDARLLRLVNRRARLAGRIGRLKRRRGLPIMDVDREAYVLDRVSRLNPGPISEGSLRRLFGSLIRECRHLEEKESASKAWNKALGSPTISILGLGLIGASLAMALKRGAGRCRVIGYDADRAVRPAGVVDRFVADPKEALKADIVVLAMPVRSIVGFLKRYGKAIPAGTLVLDVGSTKRTIRAAARSALPSDVVFIGGHPLAGKAVSGARNADPDLFEGRPFVLVPADKRALPAAKLKMAKALASGIGAVPVVMDAEAHDRVVAATSHLPNLASVALALTAESLLDRRKPVFGPAFRDMTRLALSDYGLWSDIAATNRDFVLAALSAYQKTLASLARAVRRGRFRREFDRARRFRQNLGTVPEGEASC